MAIFNYFTFVHTKIMEINILTYESQWHILTVDTKSVLEYIKEKGHVNTGTYRL